jgi:hypothetical protein
MSELTTFSKRKMIAESLVLSLTAPLALGIKQSEPLKAQNDGQE